jgi:hypothetical protein
VRRRAALVAAAALLLLAAPAAGGAAPAPTRTAYLARVSSVCLSYARRLERVPAPSDPGAYGDVISSLRRVLPLLRGQERSMRAVSQPAALRPRLAALFALDRRGIAALGRALRAAERRDAGGVATGIARFSRDSGRVHAAAVGLGIRCDPN